MTLDTNNMFNDGYPFISFLNGGNGNGSTGAGNNTSNVPLTPISRMIASLDGGIHSGVPTRTTSTLTPTTLRNIEQTFLELTNEPPASVPCQAGFVAPLPSFQFEQQPQQQQQQQHQTQAEHQELNFHSDQLQQLTATNASTTPLLQLQQYQQSLNQSHHNQPQQQQHQLHQLQLPHNHNHQHQLQQQQQLQQQPLLQQYHQLQQDQHSQHGGEENSLDSFGSETSNCSSWTSPPPTLADDSSNTNTTTATPTRRNTGGRRPKNAANLTPAEEEKRKVRRERNKLAAARCRKRRVDQTNELLDKVAVLEKEKQKMQSDMLKLQAESEQLSTCLTEHTGQCRLLNNGATTVSRKMDFKLPHQQQPQLQQLEQTGFPQQQQQHHQNQLIHQPQQQQQQLNISATTLNNNINTTINNNNNSLHHVITTSPAMPSTLNSTINVQIPRPMLLPLEKIKVEHIKVEPQDERTISANSLDGSSDANALDTPDNDDLLLGPPSAKRMLLSMHHNPIINSSSLAGCDTPTTLNTPTIPAQRPNRPSSLAVPFAITPSQCKNIADMAGVSISTPSNGVMFNFDSLMDGGTGLTPVSQPLVPTYPTSSSSGVAALHLGLSRSFGATGANGLNGNANSSGSSGGVVLDLVTPTSESSKLVSL